MRCLAEMVLKKTEKRVKKKLEKTKVRKGLNYLIFFLFEILGNFAVSLFKANSKWIYSK